MTFGEKLFKLRKEKGLSQEQLAWQVNTTRQAVSKWENDQGFPETEKLMMLGNIFSVSIDYLLKNGGEAHRDVYKRQGRKLCRNSRADAGQADACRSALHFEL